MWAHPTDASDGGVSGWPTPRVSDTEGGAAQNVEMENGSFSRKNKDGVRWGVKLRDAGESWLTPTEDDSSNVNPKPNRRPGLVSQVNETTENWPTPVAREDRAERYTEATSERHLKEGRQVHLSQVVRMDNWPTARARDWKGSGTTVIRKDGKSRMDQLMYVAEQSQFGLQAQVMPMHGSESSENDQTLPQPSPKRLNPSFVEWIMGVPTGWTSLKPLATASYQQWWENFSGR